MLARSTASLEWVAALFDDVVVAGESGERHELRGTVVHAHVRTRARAMMRQVDDVIVTVGLPQTHAA